MPRFQKHEFLTDVKALRAQLISQGKITPRDIIVDRDAPRTFHNLHQEPVLRLRGDERVRLRVGGRLQDFNELFQAKRKTKP